MRCQRPISAFLITVTLVSSSINVAAFHSHSGVLGKIFEIRHIVAPLSCIEQMPNERTEHPEAPPQMTEEEERIEEKFQTRTRKLCLERNIPFEKIKNARDLSSTKGSPITPGAIFRMGKLSDASDEDIHKLFEELNIKTMIDLRSPTEHREDETLHNDKVFKDVTTFKWKEKTGKVTESHDGENVNDKKPNMLHMGEGTPEGRVRHFVSLMDEFKYVKGTLSKLRKRDIARVILKSPGAAFSKRVRNNVKEVFLSEINDGGLPMLNELVLRMAAPGIKHVLELISDKKNHPVTFYCTAGKDRTGVISALLLSLVEVPDEFIVEDYSLSANVYAEMGDHKAMVGALSQRNLNPKTFLGAPPHVMKDTLESLRENYGSVDGYLDWIGFGAEKRKVLKEALLDAE